MRQRQKIQKLLRVTRKAEGARSAATGKCSSAKEAFLASRAEGYLSASR
ncbi:hypothetical protein SD78_0355 [Bacillus badius]|nr:hypothetical protein SD78_0355 [Bacillus badius]